MSRSLTRVLVVALLTALPLVSRTYAADSGSGALLDTFGIFALDELRTRGFTDSTSSVGVNLGDLHSGGALIVSKGTVAANSVHLGGGSVCKQLLANVVTQGSPGCGPAVPLDIPVLGTLDPADACGFPKPFPACGGPSVIVSHGSAQLLPPGTYGDVLVQGGGAGAGTLILSGGHYVFCGLRVSRYAKLYAKTATEIDVAGDLAFSNLSTVGPAPGSAITARDLKIFVNGGRVRFARKAKVHTKLCAPRGALFMNDGASLEGCALAKRIHTDRITVNGTCVLPPSSTTITTTSSSTSISTTTVETTSTIEVSTTSTSTSSTAPPPVCGNDTVDPGEDCDGSVPNGVFCLDSAGGAVLVEAECPICTTGVNGCKLDCSCCPTPGQCGTTSTTTSSTTPPVTTVPPSTTIPPTTTSTSTSVTTSTTGSSVPPTTTSTTTSTSSTTSTAPPTTTSTSTSTTSTAPPTTTSTSSTASTAPPTTTSTSTSTTSTAPPGSTTTTTLPGPLLAFTIGNGTSNCGGAGLPAASPPAAPLSGQILDGTNVKLSDLGLGCLYFGGGKNTSIPGGIIPTGSVTFFRITAQNGNALTLGGASGPPSSCTKGAGPNKHCIKGEAGTDGLGACTSDANCLNHGGSCVLDANCFFGPPLSIPNPALVGTSTCVINVIQNDVTGTGDVAVGSASVAMTLASRVYLTGSSYDDATTTTVIEACPRCINGTCNKGANQAKSCSTTAPNLVSLDCPPLASQFLATLPIALNPFTTGATSITNATGVFCPAQITSPSSSLNTGALGRTTARTVKESGTPAGNITDHAKHNGALGSTFCIPATGNQLIDPVAGLPGPGALSVAGTLQLQ